MRLSTQCWAQGDGRRMIRYACVVMAEPADFDRVDVEYSFARAAVTKYHKSVP